MRRHYYGLVHMAFMVAALIMVPRPARSQRGNEAIAEKLQEQERHIDNSDGIRQRMEERFESLQSRVDRDEGIFIGADGLLGVLLAVEALRGFSRGKASNG